MAKAPTDLRSLARSHTDTAVKTLASIMNMSDAPHAARVSAAAHLLDRGWGKPKQPVTGGDEDDRPLKIEQIQRVIIDPTNTNREGTEAAT